MPENRNFQLIYPERELHLHVLPFNCGHERHWRGELYRWHGLRRGSSPLVIWQYTLSGRGELRIGEELRSVEPGQAMLLLVPEDHCYELPADAAHWEVLFVSLHGREAWRLFSELRTRCGPVVGMEPDSRPVALAFELVRRSAAGELTDPFSASAAGYEFLMALAAELLWRRRAPEAEKYARIRRYCLEHLERPVTVSELAALAGQSYHHFCREFRRHTGQSALAYVNSLRLELAMRLLQSSQAPVKEIAGACGYEDAGYFGKVFRRRYGLAPGAVRKVHVAPPGSEMLNQNISEKQQPRDNEKC